METLNFSSNAIVVLKKRYLNKDNEGKVTTLGKIIITALMNAKVSSPEPGTEKRKRWKLADKIDKADNEINLSVKEIASIVEFVGEVFNPAIVGPACEILDPSKD